MRRTGLPFALGLVSFAGLVELAAIGLASPLSPFAMIVVGLAALGVPWGIRNLFPEVFVELDDAFSAAVPGRVHPGLAALALLLAAYAVTVLAFGGLAMEAGSRLVGAVVDFIIGVVIVLVAVGFGAAILLGLVSSPSPEKAKVKTGSATNEIVDDFLARREKKA